MNELQYRELNININGGAKTVDIEGRSVEVIAATENPVQIFDYEHGVIDEVIIVDNMKIPSSRQIPLLNAHNRGDANNVIGSARNLRIENNQLLATVVFAKDEESERTFQKIIDGHINDVSIGYRVKQSEYIEDNETKKINGRMFAGRKKVVTESEVKELSIVPIGADETAKIRAEAHKDNNPKTRSDTMDKTIRAHLVSQGLPENANDDETLRFIQSLKTADIIDLEGEKQRAIREERERAEEINALCKRFDFGDMAQKLINDGVSVADATRKVFERIDSQKTETFQRATVIHDERDKFRDAAQDSIMIRAGMKVEKPAHGHDDLMSFGLLDMARHILKLEGKPLNGSKMDIAGRALTSTSLTNIFLNVANKSVNEGYVTANETWSIWAGTGSVPDFKTATLIRASETDDLAELPEGTPYTYGSLTDAKEQVQIVTYAKMTAFSRQALINDDLGVLTDIPMKHGEAAARKIGDIVYAVLTGNPAMGDGVVLFHADHANIAAGATIDPPGITTIGAGVLAMGIQKDIKGKRRLNIRPEFYIAPKTLEFSSEVLFRSVNYLDEASLGTPDDAVATTRINPFGGSYFTRVYDSRLDDISTTAWYLAAGRGKTVKVFFLNGQQAPYMEMQQGWNVDGVEMKVRIDAAAKAIDWKTLYYNAGT